MASKTSGKPLKLRPVQWEPHSKNPRGGKCASFSICSITTTFCYRSNKLLLSLESAENLASSENKNYDTEKQNRFHRINSTIINIWSKWAQLCTTKAQEIEGFRRLK